ncbi:MAG: hypothetical protein KatS3mg011_2040 [Acidimicrobiia bacterium]|nr:MAG: hypothetical protein KatS3mg011_2040 [Acidimicrobiia bacterium]
MAGRVAASRRGCGLRPGPHLADLFPSGSPPRVRGRAGDVGGPFGMGDDPVRPGAPPGGSAGGTDRRQSPRHSHPGRRGNGGGRGVPGVGGRAERPVGVGRRLPTGCVVVGDQRHGDDLLLPDRWDGGPGHGDERLLGGPAGGTGRRSGVGRVGRCGLRVEGRLLRGGGRGSRIRSGSGRRGSVHPWARWRADQPRRAEARRPTVGSGGRPPPPGGSPRGVPDLGIHSPDAGAADRCPGGRSGYRRDRLGAGGRRDLPFPGDARRRKGGRSDRPQGGPGARPCWSREWASASSRFRRR